MSDHGGKHDDGHGKKHKSHGGGHGGHGGGGHEEHEGAPEWLISFADMVMLMMGFFVIMFALNVQPKGGNAGGGGEQAEGVANEPDFVDFAIAVRRAFHTLDNLDPNDPSDRKLLERMEQAQGAGDSRDEGTKGKDRDVKSVRDSNYYGKGTVVTFSHRSTQLDEDATRVLAEFAAKNRGRNNVLEVRGHASQAEAFRKPEEAMAIAYDRAMAAARALAASGIDWWRLRIEVCGDHDRVAANPNTADADAQNARVEITVSNEIAPPQVPSGPADRPEGPAAGSPPASESGGSGETAPAPAATSGHD